MPIRKTTDSQPRPTHRHRANESSPKRVSTDSVTADVRAHAEWMDRYAGNNDGFLDARELRRFERRYGDEGGYDGVVRTLRSQLQPVPSPAHDHADATTQTVRASDLQRQTVVPASNDSAPADAVGERRHARLVASLVRPGGSGDRRDVELIRSELARVPTRLLESAQARGLTVVACRDNVTDHLESLRGRKPRGWPEGSDWSRVPGTYDGARRQVVVATDETRDGRRDLRTLGEGHGAYSLVLHEFAHGLDRSRAVRGFNSDSREFVRAYEADRARLVAEGETYLLQHGDAGREEAFAEIFARYHGGDQDVRREFPNLTAFFERHAGPTQSAA